MIVRPVSSQVAPDALDERVAAELLARGALLRELLLDDVLGRDAGVVVARLPERVVALHPVPADQHVLDRAVERVAHVQRAGDVRRRHADHERLLAALARARAVEAFVLPGALPALLDAVRLVQRLHGRDRIGGQALGLRRRLPAGGVALHPARVRAGLQQAVGLAGDGGDAAERPRRPRPRPRARAGAGRRRRPRRSAPRP